MRRVVLLLMAGLLGIAPGTATYAAAQPPP
jgi:hypothetical protein